MTSLTNIVKHTTTLTDVTKHTASVTNQNKGSIKKWDSGTWDSGNWDSIGASIVNQTKH